MRVLDDFEDLWLPGFLIIFRIARFAGDRFLIRREWVGRRLAREFHRFMNGGIDIIAQGGGLGDLGGVLLLKISVLRDGNFGL